MDEQKQTIPNGSLQQDTRRRRGSFIRRNWLLGAGATILVIAYLLHMPTQYLRLPNGKHIDVLQLDRNIQVQINPRTGERTWEDRLLLRYYSDQKTPDEMRAEARDIAPMFFPTADNLALRVVVLKPSQPWLARSFPITVTSYYVRFLKNNGGRWEEKKY